jgi:hypothetical protein
VECKQLAEVTKLVEVSEPTFHRWRAQYGGMKAEDAKRLKELERESARLQAIVADQAFENRLPFAEDCQSADCPWLVRPTILLEADESRLPGEQAHAG